jgi:transposase
MYCAQYMRQTPLTLLGSDRPTLNTFRAQGFHSARSRQRAHMLGAREQQVSEGEIPRGLGVGRTTIGRTRGAYLETGLASALADAPRPGHPRTYGPKVAAEISAWACTAAPAGAQRWTLQWLHEPAPHRVVRPGISRETIRRILTKTFSGPGAR